MPDTEISKLPPLSLGQLRGEDVLAIADVSMTETKKVRADDLVVSGLSAVPDGSLDPNKLNWSILNSDSISGDDLSDGSIADEKLIANTLTARSIAPNAIGASELANSSVDTAALKDQAVTAAKVQSNSLGDAQIIDGGISTSSLANSSVTVNKLSLNNGELNGSLITDGSITENELAPNLPGNILSNGAIGSDELADYSVTDTKLAVDSVTTNAVQDSAITDAHIANVNGTKVINGTIAATKFNAGTFGRGLSNNGTDVGIANAIPAATASGISWNAQGLITGSTPLQGTDLPVATNSNVGGVSVPGSGGLAVSGIGEVSIANSIPAGTTSGITFNEQGLITSTAALVDTDLPTATTTRIGGVSVPTSNNNPLTISAAGELRLGLSDFTATNGLASVDVDEFGLVTGGSTKLTPDQIPSLDASKINTGQFDNSRIGDDAIQRRNLANYSISFIQEAEPTNLSGVHIGMLWFQESTGQLRMFNGNSFFAVGFGRLAQDNLRFCGTVDASTGLVTTLTDNGRTAGFTVGAAIPSATDALSGTYLVIDTAGSNIAVVPATNFDEGDWVLCIDLSGGFVRIDAMSGGGGGSALLRLNDLLDVDINSPQAGDGLFYDPTTNNWTNRTTATSRITIVESFDGARTSFTLSDTVTTVNTTLLVLSGVLQEPGVDYQIADGTNVLNFSSPPSTGSDYYMLTQYVDTGGGSGGGGGGTTLPPGTAAEEYLQWNSSLAAWAPSTELDGGSF